MVIEIKATMGFAKNTADTTNMDIIILESNSKDGTRLPYDTFNF